MVPKRHSGISTVRSGNARHDVSGYAFTRYRAMHGADLSLARQEASPPHNPALPAAVPHCATDYGHRPMDRLLRLAVQTESQHPSEYVQSVFRDLLH